MPARAPTSPPARCTCVWPARAVATCAVSSRCVWHPLEGPRGPRHISRSSGTRDTDHATNPYAHYTHAHVRTVAYVHGCLVWLPVGNVVVVMLLR